MNHTETTAFYPESTYIIDGEVIRIDNWSNELITNLIYEALTARVHNTAHAVHRAEQSLKRAKKRHTANIWKMNNPNLT
jgi:hypothetical protein